MSIDSSPPAQPPQMSPDGKWVWDGSQWQPVVGVEPTHESVFAAWNSIHVDPADPAAPAAEVQRQSPAPATDYSYPAPDYPASEPIVPLWQQTKGPGISRYMYPAVGLVVLVMLMVVLNSINFIQLPWIGSGSSNATQPARPSPTPDASGSDFVRADRLLNNLKPPFKALDQTIPALNLGCVTLSTSCYDALTASKEQAKKVIAVMENADISPCIAAPMVNLRADAKGMGDQLELALKGFQDNDKSEVSAGINHFLAYRQSAGVDVTAALQVENRCLKVEVPSWVPR